MVFGAPVPLEKEKAKIKEVKGIRYTQTGADTYTYRYSHDGTLLACTDAVNGTSHSYLYDSAGRLSRTLVTETATGRTTAVLEYDYDEYDQLSGYHYALPEGDGLQWYHVSTDFAYDRGLDTDRRLTGRTVQRGETNLAAFAYSYDAMSRLKTRQTEGMGLRVGESYTYKSTYVSGVGTLQSDKPATVTVTVTRLADSTATLTLTYSYSYDKDGNILCVSDGTYATSYVYDNLNRLTRENNQALSKTVVYTYDSNHNITSRTEYAYTTGTLGAVRRQINYTYGSNGWGDVLVSRNEVTNANIDPVTYEYDAMGNPTTWDEYGYKHLFWQNGRQLASDGTAMNIDGSVHDAMRGVHTLTNNERIWIFDNGWGG